MLHQAIDNFVNCAVSADSRDDLEALPPSLFSELNSMSRVLRGRPGSTTMPLENRLEIGSPIP
jgi:hypothetical protein